MDMNILKMRALSDRWSCALWILLIALILAPAVPGMARDDDTVAALRRAGRVFAEIAREAYPKVVVVETDRPGSAERAPRSPQGRLERRRFQDRAPFEAVPSLTLPQIQREARGLGMIVSSNGLILTSSHVISDAGTVRVTLADDRSFNAKVVGADPATGIAVIRVEASNLPAFELTDTDAVELGDWVVSIGNPMGIGRTFTVSLVTGKDRSRLGMVDYESYVQIDQALNFGDTGGPLLNLDGQVVGISAATVAGRTGAGFGLAIPIDMVKYVYEQLVATGKVRRGFLGVALQDINPEIAEALRLPPHTGALIADVVGGSPAAEAGWKKRDVIVELNGVRIRSSDQLRLAVARLKPGEQVELVVMSDGQRETHSIKLAQRPGPR
jgi:serine protease Do